MNNKEFILFIILIISIVYLCGLIIIQKFTMDAIKNCYGSPSCIESTVSVMLYKQTPCLDEIEYGGNK